MEWIKAKSILSGYVEGNSWFGTNYNMNIYRGCSHGCIYCDSRSDCYHVENFDVVSAKANALMMIERELQSKRKKGVIGTGAMSDPYNPQEKLFELTRGALTRINRYGFGIAVATKSHLITRDIDLYQQIAHHSPVLAKVTITTADDALCAKLEPNVARSSVRFDAIKKLSDAGIFTGILMMPVLPFLEDNTENIRAIVDLAHQNGAKFIYPAFGVTLRQNQRVWFLNKLGEQFPEVKQQYLDTFGNAYECRSPNAKGLWRQFKHDCEERGILYRMADIVHAYKAPYTVEQLSFFD
ncbi:radical SAM protein [Fusibacter paucivorans]|uniref:Radical SAM protein n=1 Tax=Fusibacter paucivorans TaxID=76009 RepID=A0ABS5PU01_9FIRM|nr:radical SAM protein [Fusibacter paucivorans]MBS7527869.1 radical SAM protein [Fusibacter paucivorans]